MYRVISPFRDLKNDEHLYQDGDMYPVEGYKPTKARIKELAEGKNPLNRVFIEKVEETLRPARENPLLRPARTRLRSKLRKGGATT